MPTRKPSQAKLLDIERRRKHLLEMDVSIAYQNALIDNEEAILDLLRTQMSQGLSGNDGPIMLYDETSYQPFTVRYKKAFGFGLGAVTDRITLYMTGEFYARMFMTIKGESFTIKSNVPYFDDIINMTGPEVMSLNSENYETLVNLWINPEIKKVVQEHLHP